MLQLLEKVGGEVAAGDQPFPLCAFQQLVVAGEEVEELLEVYGADGSQKFTIKPFDTAGTGVSLAVGDLGL